MTSKIRIVGKDGKILYTQEEIIKMSKDITDLQCKLTKEQKKEKLNKLLGISLLLLKEKEILKKEIQKQKRLRVIRIAIGTIIGFTVSILIYYRILS